MSHPTPPTSAPTHLPVDDPVPPPGVLVVYSDIWCSFAHIAIHRLHTARTRLGLDDVVAFDLRAFPLELLNSAPSPRPGTDSEVAGVAAHEPDAGWQLWQNPDYTYPTTMLPALEAVQAAKLQSYRAAEALDRGLRRGFWAESRCVSYRREILAIAEATGVVEVDTLAADLDTGRARPMLSAQAATAATDRVSCSPHLFLPDGTDAANPGIGAGWHGSYGVGWPLIDHDDPKAVDELLERTVAIT